MIGGSPVERQAPGEEGAAAGGDIEAVTFSCGAADVVHAGGVCYATVQGVLVVFDVPPVELGVLRLAAAEGVATAFDVPSVAAAVPSLAGLEMTVRGSHVEAVFAVGAGSGRFTREEDIVRGQYGEAVPTCPTDPHSAGDGALAVGRSELRNQKLEVRSWK